MPRFKTLALSTVALPFALAGCAATGGGAIPDASAPIAASEAQQGAEANPQILAEFGGAMSG
ncbi:MAG: M48 family metalloprotease, partial [Tsuneonella sp.]